MSAFMTFGDIGPVVGATLLGQKLSRIEPVLVLSPFAKQYTLPKNKGEVLKMRRLRPLPVSTTNLTEGVTPAPSQITYDTVTVVIGQYGNWVQITDVIQDIAEDPVLNDAADLLSDQAAATKEMILWGVLRGGSQVIYANGANRAAVNTPVDTDLFMAAVKLLKRNHAKMNGKMIKASTSIATEPVGRSYLAFGHTDLERDLRLLSDFVPTERYANSDKVVSEWEIGKVTNCRIILSPDLPGFADAGGTATGMTSTTGTNADVYPIVVIGEEFFGDLRLAGMENVGMQVMKPGTLDKSDPLSQRGFVSWKAWFAATRLNELWGVRIEVAATALS